MTWTHYWTVIGITYPLYYALNVAYDLLKQGKTQKNSHQVVYDMSNVFSNNTKPTVVNIEDYTVSSTVVIPEYEQPLVENQGMTTSELLKALSSENTNIALKIFS